MSTTYICTCTHARPHANTNTSYIIRDDSCNNVESWTNRQHSGRHSHSFVSSRTRGRTLRHAKATHAPVPTSGHFCLMIMNSVQCVADELILIDACAYTTFNYAPNRSYPTLGGDKKQLQHPDLHLIAKLAEEAGVDLRVLVLTRNPYAIAKSTTENRLFGGGFNEEIEMLTENAAAITSQLNLIDPVRTHKAWHTPRAQTNTQSPRHNSHSDRSRVSSTVFDSLAMCTDEVYICEGLSY